jgi:transposase
VKIDSIDVEAAINNARELINSELDLSPALRSSMEVLLLVITLLFNRTTLSSKNSSKPPASDPNRLKSSRAKSSKPSGAQLGHVGKTLVKIDDPDEVEVLSIDRRALPKGDYHSAGVETRQVFDIDISRVVTEYQAEVLENAQGQRFVAQFPEGVTKAVQYGTQIKAHAVYLSQHQLLPYNRIQTYFSDQCQIPISEGTLFNFNLQAFKQLADFEQLSKDQLSQASIAHADETGININGKRHWLHCASNSNWTHFYPHQKRGAEAMNDIGILPRYQGILCHDHWKPYYRYDFTHALCNAHHLRELERAWGQDQQSWAKEMQQWLKTINQAVDDAGGAVTKKKADIYRQQYRHSLKQADIECPPPDAPPGKAKRGRIKRSKARNLLERLTRYEEDVLRFMENPLVPFTNNRGENDIRMTKVQQKISGCFRSEEGAKIFCRVRGYLSTCRKQKINASQALRLVFEGKLPDFVQ